MIAICIKANPAKEYLIKWRILIDNGYHLYYYHANLTQPVTQLPVELSAADLI